ncbi:MAG: uracil-DNA glycosylase family protein, partial [Candidatus Thorarchaeota archaeon]
MIDIVFLALRPEKAEYITGQGFGGSFGHLAKDMIINAGIDTRRCLFRYVYTHPVKDSEEEVSSIQKLLQRLRPKITVLLGSGVMKLFFPNHKSLEKHRGSLYFTEYGKMMATFDPIMVMKQYTKRYITELDLKRALLESSSWELSIPEMNFIIRPTFEQVMEFLTKPHERLSFDVETTGKNIRCLGFSDKKNHAICIPFIAKSRKVNEKTLFQLDVPSETIGSYWTLEEEAAIVTELNRIFLDKSIQKIAQNYPFDSMALAREFGFHIEGLYMDTMVAMHCCYSELPKSLDFLTSIFTKIPYYADHEVSNDESEWTYNCYDCAATFEVAEVLEQEMMNLQVNEFYETHAQPTMLALTRAGNRGIKIDVKLRAELKDKAEKS